MPLNDNPLMTFLSVRDKAQAHNMAQQHADMQTAGVLSSLRQHERANRLDDAHRAAIATGDIEAIRKVDPVLALKLTEGGALSDLRRATIGKLTEQTNTVRSQRDAAAKVGAQLDPNSAVWSPENSSGMPRPSVVVPSMTDDQARAMDAASGGAPLSIGVPNQGTLAGLAAQMDPRAGSALMKQVNPAAAAPMTEFQRRATDLRDRSLTLQADNLDARKTKEVASAGTAGVGMMDPETLKFTAQQIWAGDRQAGQGFARSAPMKAALQKAIMEEGQRRGATGQELAGIMAEYEGQKSGQRALGTRQAQIEMAANVTSQFAPLAVAASEGFDRTPFKSLNDVEKAVLSRTASPELRKFNVANTSLINAYARAVNPTGVGTVSDKEHAREMLDTGFAKGDYKAAVDQLMVEINAELKAPGAVKKDMRKLFNEGGPVPTGAVTAPGMRGSDQDLINKYLKPAAAQ